MFTMPAEWMPHDRCWMAWPCRHEVWGSDILAGCFPYREIVQVPVHHIAIGGGGIHCITQQQPKIN